MTDIAESTPEQTLAWEAERRPTAAAAAALAGILTIGGNVYLAAAISSKSPTVGPLQALGPALSGRPDVVPDVGSKKIVYIDDHLVGLIVSSVIIGIGALFLAYTLRFLFEATRARRPEMVSVARYLAVGAPIAVGVLGIASQIVITTKAHHFAGLAPTAMTQDAVDDVRGATAFLILNYLAIAAQLGVAFAFIFICINAMRAGLLTRFMGVLGIIAGVLFVLPIGSPLPIVQSFWLVALAPLFLLRTPNGGLPAWRTGKAEPWPTQQQLREAREAEERDGDAALGDAPAPATSLAAPDAGDEPDVPTARPHPSSKKRKRRR